MKSRRLRDLAVIAFSVVVIGAMGTAVAYSPTLYRMVCAMTGIGGTVRRAAAAPAAEAAEARTVTLLFDANVAPGLSWEFRPEKRKVVTRLGEPTKIYYYAKNLSDRTVVARAVYNVTPYKAAPYFFKIQCFCFTNERLAPGESARMPVVLYVDDQILKDPDTQDVHEITLSYTFFRQTGLSPKEVAAARELKSGSAETEAKLHSARTLRFDNDAPRR